MPENCAVLEVYAMPEDGTTAEEGFGLKLANVFVKKPVDAPVPIG